MDRNEVILVGRLPEVAHIRSLRSGSTLGTWRLIVRRQHRGRGARVDTIPCASFETEVIEAVAGWLPDDIVEVTGSLRRRWWGNEGAKSSGYEVEVRSVRRLERKVTMILTGDEGDPVAAPLRSVHSLLHARKVAEGLQTREETTGQAGAGSAGQTGEEITGQAGEGSARQTGEEGAGQGGESRITPARPGLTSVPDPTISTGPDPATSTGPDPTPVGLDLARPDSGSFAPQDSVVLRTRASRRAGSSRGMSVPG
ncbi:hypothetical protein GCM10022252_53480 [Streptosporangium oxazolinicum]|uniref:Single-stranded DNA-binding protein n=1 Tax=Streptosporangium oxazolinicum TaxID=909287 RepID=A0ABP8B816_9ACTN